MFLLSVTDWSCHLCTYINKDRDDICDVCSSPNKMNTHSAENVNSRGKYCNIYHVISRHHQSWVKVPK